MFPPLCYLHNVQQVGFCHWLLVQQHTSQCVSLCFFFRGASLWEDYSLKTDLLLSVNVAFRGQNWTSSSLNGVK